MCLVQHTLPSPGNRSVARRKIDAQSLLLPTPNPLHPRRERLLLILVQHMRQKNRVKTLTDLRSLCRAHTAAVVRMLIGIVMSPEANAAARVRAGEIILNRGWGMPDQFVGMAVAQLGPGDARPDLETLRAFFKQQAAMQQANDDTKLLDVVSESVVEHVQQTDTDPK